MKLTSFLLAASFVLASTPAAFGQDTSAPFLPALPATSAGSTSSPPAPAPPPAQAVAPRTGPTWYGWQTLLSDAATTVTTMGLASAAPNNAGLIALNMYGGFALAPPIIHAAHGRPWIALADLALRAATAVGASVLFFDAVTSCTGGSDPAYPTHCNGETEVDLAGFLVIAMVAVDAAALSWETHAETRPAPSPKPLDAFSISPRITWTKSGAGIAVQGTF